MPGVVFSTGNGPWSVGSQPQTLTTHGFSSGRIVASCIRAAAWCCCCHGNCAVSTQPISSFSNAVNRQLSADAFSEEIIHNGPNLIKLYQPVLGVRFFWNTVYVQTNWTAKPSETEKLRKNQLGWWNVWILATKKSLHLRGREFHTFTTLSP